MLFFSITTLLDITIASVLVFSSNLQLLLLFISLCKLLSLSAVRMVSSIYLWLLILWYIIFYSFQILNASLLFFQWFYCIMKIDRWRDTPLFYTSFYSLIFTCDCCSLVLIHILSNFHIFTICLNFFFQALVLIWKPLCIFLILYSRFLTGYCQLQAHLHKLI